MSSPEAVFYAFRGYFSKIQDDSLAIRNAATIIYRALGGKKNMDTIWPLTNDEPKETFAQPTKEWYREMRKKQALIDKQILSERHKDKTNG